jgi:hypothetical protein
MRTSLMVALTLCLVACATPVDPEAFEWVNGLLAEHWCCEERDCYPGRSGEPLYLSDPGGARMPVISHEEWEALPEYSRGLIPGQCRHMAGYGNNEWMDPRYETGDGQVFVYGHSVRNAVAPARTAWAFTWINPVREEKHFMAYATRGDCLEARHSTMQPGEGAERVSRVSECVEVTIEAGRVHILGR